MTKKSENNADIVKLKDLVINDEDTPIGDIMDDSVMSVDTLTDQEDLVIAKLCKYLKIAMALEKQNNGAIIRITVRFPQ